MTYSVPSARSISKAARMADDLMPVTGPVDTAHGLPNRLYSDRSAIDLELQAVFGPNWTGIGFASDVPERGDVMPLEFLGEPLLLVRDREDVVHVYQNTCRHRGVVLVAEPHNSTGLIRCPYHAWCYDLKGSLKQTPHAGGPGIHEHAAIDKKRLGLVELPSHVYMDVVFVNLGMKANPFETCFPGLLQRWRDFDRPIFSAGADSRFTLTVNCNWKLAVENYCESYHLPFVHPGLNAYSRLEDHENILGDGPWSGQLTNVYAPKADPSGLRFDNFDRLPPRWETNAEYVAVYPNVLFGVHRDHTFAIILEPVSHDRTHEHISIYYASAQMTGASHRALREKNALQWKQVFLEDVSVVEAMQRGRLAGHFDGGRFSPVMDAATHHFHGWIAAQILEEPQAA